MQLLCLVAFIDENKFLSYDIDFVLICRQASLTTVPSSRYYICRRIPLKLGLNNHDGYMAPNNKLYGALEPPFLYFGFIPIANATNKKTQGLTVNGNRT